MSSSTLAIEEATCPDVDDPSRKRKDPTGDGKTWRIGSYHHTQHIDHHQVDSLSCGPFTYYNIQHNYGNAPNANNDYSNAVEKDDEGQGLTDGDMRLLSTSKDYVQSGNTKGVQPAYKVGTVTLSGDHVDSNECCRDIKDDWARTCSKNNNALVYKSV